MCTQCSRESLYQSDGKSTMDAGSSTDLWLLKMATCPSGWTRSWYRGIRDGTSAAGISRGTIGWQTRLLQIGRASCRERGEGEGGGAPLRDGEEEGKCI